MAAPTQPSTEPQRRGGRRGAALSDVSDVKVRYRTIHGHRRAYRKIGKGPALLLLHGIGDSSQTWVPLMRTLAKRFTVIAPDLLGHGDSDKPRADYSVAAYANGMRDLLTVLGVESATVVGHSLGGGVAAQFAYQYPDMVQRLVLVATGGVARDVNPALRLASAPFAELVTPVLQWPIGRVIGGFTLDALALVGADIGRDADEIKAVFGAFPDRDARGAFTRTLRSVVDWRGQVVTMLDRAYLATDVPTMLVWGAHDAVIPVSHVRQAEPAFVGCRAEIYPEAGHFPHRHEPERFIADLVDFVESTEPATHDAARWRQRITTR